jgi:T5SS/PEP-CTERM-associated repeat protein
MRVDVRKLTVFGVLWIGAAVLLLPASSATGTITTTGQIDPAYNGSADPWTISGDLKVGNTGAGHMTVSGASKVVDVNAYVGYLSGSTADVLVTGTGALWQNSGGLYIGGSRTQAGGTGLLTITLGRVEANQAVIWAGGSLAGNGTLKAASVTNGGTIRPAGSSIGTLTIDGNLTFQPSSVLEVEVNNSGNSDKLAVTGNVNIVGGTVKAISTETITGAKQYTIIDANKVTGTFTTLDTALLHVAFVDPNERLGYTAKQVLLNITADPFDLRVGQTPNQQALGTALQRIANVGSTGVTTALQQLPTLNAVRSAYDQLNGQSRPPLAPIAATDTAKFMGIVSNRLQAARGAVAMDLQSLSDGPLLAMAEPTGGFGSISDRTRDSFLWDLGPSEGNEPDQGWGTWGKVYALFGDRKTKNGATGYSYNVLGESGGVDIQLTERFTGGATGGYSSGQVDYDTVNDTAELGTTHAGLYSTYSGDGWYLNSIATYSWINLSTERVVDLIAQRHEGSFDGREWSGYAEAGFDWQPRATWLVQPLGSFQVSHLRLNSYVETGHISNLVYEPQEYDSYQGSLGVKVTKELALGMEGHSAIVQARGRWVHEFGDVVSNVETHFLDVPLYHWTVSDEGLDRDSILVGGGAGIRLTKGLRAFVDYDMSFNADRTVQVVSGALDYRW